MPFNCCLNVDYNMWVCVKKYTNRLVLKRTKIAQIVLRFVRDGRQWHQYHQRPSATTGSRQLVQCKRQDGERATCVRGYGCGVVGWVDTISAP